MPESRKQAGVQSRQQIEARERSMKEIAEAYRSASEDHQWQQPKGLTRQQQRALKELEDAWEEVRQWCGDDPQNESERKHQLADQARYKKAIMRTVRAELWHHPIVRAWLAARRSLGDWEELRRFRLGLEHGVKTPMSKDDFWVAFEAHDLIDRGDGPEAIRAALIDKLKSEKPQEWFDLNPGEIARLIGRLDCSRQNFHQWLRRLKII